jgi:pSer/pThr/pTyr-binding forkhead associated (FHA) protein
LEVVDCEGSPDLVGRRYPLERVTLIGREVDSTAVLPDPRVSAHHARLMSRNGDWWLEDLGSMNGTFVDEVPVAAATLVDPGAQLRFGPVVARLASRTARR